MAGKNVKKLPPYKHSVDTKKIAQKLCSFYFLLKLVDKNEFP